MVSFQCHGCGDVVKKPKLDQHHGHCHAGFDCIDCSVTFNAPAEYKSHTSCITEAEKYQKSLYKGKKGGENGNGDTNGYSGATRGGQGGRGRGGYGGRGGYQGGPRNEGTGANSTAIGTPQRMSPVTAPTEETLRHKTQNENGAANTKAVAPASSLDTMPTSSPVKNEDNSPGPGPSSELSKKEKKRKDQKSKSKSKLSHGEVKADESGVVEPATATVAASSDEAIGTTEKKEKKRLDGQPSIRDDRKAGESDTVGHAPVPAPLSSDKKNDTTAEKKKKRKKAEGEQSATSEQSKMVIDEQGERDGSKEEEKKSKGDRSTSNPRQNVSAQAEGEGSRKKRMKSEDEAPVRDESRTKVDEHDKVVDSKEKKKKSKDRAPDVDASEENLETQGEKKESKEKRKKEKHESRKSLDEPVVPPAGSARAALQGEVSEKKTKKRRREDDGSEHGEVTVVNAERKKVQKSSEKDLHSADSASASATTEIKDSVTLTEPLSGRKRKRQEKDNAKDAADVSIPNDGKEKKKRKHKKELAEGAKE